MSRPSLVTALDDAMVRRRTIDERQRHVGDVALTPSRSDRLRPNPRLVIRQTFPVRRPHTGRPSRLNHRDGSSPSV